MNVQIADDRSGRDSVSKEIAGCIPALRKFARILTRNEEAAADLTQETLAKAWQARHNFVPGTNLRAWLFAIMRNHFRSEMRRAWRQMPWDPESAERIPTACDQQMWSLNLLDAARAIEALSTRQREALILASVGGFSSEDVGAITRCRPTAAKSRISRARHAIRSMLDGTEPLRNGRRGRQGDTVNDLVSQLQKLVPAVAA